MTLRPRRHPRKPMDGEPDGRVYRRIIDDAFDLRVRIARDRRVTLCPEDAAQGLGYAAEEVIGRSFLSFIHPRDAGTFMKVLERLHGSRETESFSVRVKDAQGHWRRFEAYGVAAVSGGDVLLVGRELRGRQSVAADRSRSKMPRDPITSLPMRSAYLGLLEQAIARAEREQLGVAVFVIDIDRFALINDELGRPTGDAVLREHARRLTAVFSAQGNLARGDGDEFLGYACVRKGADEALLLAHEVRGALSEPVSVDGHEIFSTASVGIALYPADGDRATHLVDHAVAAMRHAKRSDGDGQAFFGAISGRKYGRLSLDAGLRSAVINGELEVFYQPVVRLDDEALIGCEALVRWHHPQHGLLLPDEFLGVSEETATILSIGAWVLRTACEQLAAWRSDGIGALRLAVNVSARQLREQRFADFVTWVLSVTKLDAGSLTLEITESVAVRLAEQDASSLKALRNAGVDLAIDDFGMGHASLSYLKHLPVNQVKIDKAFVQGSMANAVDAAIVRGIAAMAREMGLDVVAEGVETKEHAAFLRAAGCNEAQGFLYAPPLRAAEFAAYCASRRPGRPPRS